MSTLPSLVSPTSAQNLGTSGNPSTTRPGSEEEPTQIKVGIFLFELTDINDAEQTYSASIIIHASWHDPRLAHGTGKTRTLELNEVWHPRVQIANEERLFARFHEKVEVEPNGEVIYRQRYTGKLVAALKLHDFPMDTQSLSVQLVFPDYSPSEVQIVPDESTTGQSTIFHVADWEIKLGQIRVAPIPFLKGVERAGVIYEFQAERYRGYYYWKILLPLVLIVLYVVGGVLD